MLSKKGVILSAALVPCLNSVAVHAKAVFCHYLIGTVTAEHAQQDVQQAKSVGCDAFALDLLDATADFTTTTVQELFDAAQQENFKLFFSVDISADKNINDFDNFLQQYLSNSAYYTAGPNNYPLVSTFDEGGLGPQAWAAFRQKYNNGNLFFIPDFDDVPSYYDNPTSFFSTYGDTIDGAFNWETAWPSASLTTHQNVSTDSDIPVQRAAEAASKSFMIGLSSLQFKDIASLGAPYFRIGDINLPQRMAEILALETAPDFVEIITWNDAGESHYIGNVWDESGPQPYSQGEQWRHAGWQPLVSSFITAYRNGVDNSKAMTPPSGNAVGALWYRTNLKTSSCTQPSGALAAVDAVNYAVVVDPEEASSGYQVRITSGGTVLGTMPVTGGLNYMAVPGIQAGAQKMELLDGSGNTVMTASGAVDVATDVAGNCNFNFQVAGLQ